MALIKCPECGKEVSSNAVACPHCGNPVPKKMCPVRIERNSTIAMAVNCYVFIDGSMRGEIKSGKSMEIELPVGSHNIYVESNVRAFGYSAADTRSMSGEQFTITDSTRSVSIVVKTKGSWTGGVGKCIIDSISCH